MAVNDINFNETISHYWTVWILLAFLAIAKMIYFIIISVNDSRSYDVRMSELLDTFIFGFLGLYVFIWFFSSTDVDRENLISDSLIKFRDYLDYPFSIVSLTLFLLGFYTIIYFLKIPMDQNKSIAIWWVENIVVFMFILLFIVDFFELFFKIDLVKIVLTDGIIYQVQKIIPPVTSAPTTKAATISPTTKKSGFSTMNGGLVEGMEGNKKEEVFNISNDVYTYEDAKNVCSLYDAKLATYDQVEEAYKDGAEWCNYGWSDEQMVFYPTQRETYNKLKKNPLTANMCGRPGVNGGYIKNPKMQFGVNCYGVKPAATPEELELMKKQKEIPDYLQEDPILKAKFKKWKENRNEFLVVNSFNRDKWSEF